MSNLMDYEINKELGECYLFMGDYEKAEEYYHKAAENNTESAAPYMGLATIAVQRSDLDTALSLYQKAASLEESDKALCGIALVCMERGQHEDAYSWFRKSLDLAADNIVALNCLVREAYHLNRVDEILPYLENALQVSSEADSVRVTLAGCLMFLRRNAEAKVLLESVLAQDPSNINAKDLYA
ncbi:MAG: tetratricopeptide repeat protein, partial [Desulfovibrio sp.]|nr:tetratricopeptide repeat protein [Desulfovibrio sp.]